MDNTGVLDRAAAGDEHAWDELLTQYGRMLRAVAGRLRMRNCDAEDAAQLTWLALHENIGAIRNPDSVGAWLASVMRHRCLAMLAQMRRELLDDDMAERSAPESGCLELSDLELSDLELPVEVATTLWDLVGRLPDRERTVLRALFDGTDRSYREVAHDLQIPIGSLGPVRMRALRRLSRMLAEAGISADTLYA